MLKNKISQIEKYVKKVIKREVAHGFKHVDRVRNRALCIARREGYKNLEVVEAAALLHDIGLPFVKQRKMHGKVGARMAEKFLKENKIFLKNEIKEITNAIRYHNSNRTGRGKLLYILRDADMLDAIGAMGIMRCIAYYSLKPEYNPKNIKSETWGMGNKHFNKRIDSGMGAGRYIMDELNFNISFYDIFRTKTGKKIAKPLVEFMKNYIIQLESEANKGRDNGS